MNVIVLFKLKITILVVNCYYYMQALYNTQLQQAQYYQQQMYGGGATSPSSSNIMPSPYYYLQAPSPRPYPHQHHQHYAHHIHQQQQQQRLPSTSSYLIYPSNFEAPTTSSNAPTSQEPVSSSTGTSLNSSVFSFLKPHCLSPCKCANAYTIKI